MSAGKFHIELTLLCLERPDYKAGSNWYLGTWTAGFLLFPHMGSLQCLSYPFMVVYAEHLLSF